MTMDRFQQQIKPSVIALQQRKEEDQQEVIEVPSTASLDFLDDDDAPPPPPPDDDDTSSTHSSPDDSYGPVRISDPFGHQFILGNVREFVPMQLPDADEVHFECLEDEGNSGPPHLDGADNVQVGEDQAEAEDEKADSYNGGTTSTERDDDDDEHDEEEAISSIDESCSVPSACILLLHDSDAEAPPPERPATDSPAARKHPFLDLDQQRRQADWDKAQRRAEYHSKMQRQATLDYNERVIALRLLLHEAARHHVQLRRRGYSATLHGDAWRAIGEAALHDVDVSGPVTVQRLLSCMCLFSGPSTAREYGDHEAERCRRALAQQRTLDALQRQADQEEGRLFFRSPNITMLSSPRHADPQISRMC